MVGQIILGVLYIHSKGVYHGDLKSENVLVSSSKQAVMVDMGFYKPYFLEMGDYSSYMNYYGKECGRSEGCSIAPEKLVEKAEDLVETGLLSQMDEQLLRKLQRMDLFSLGCLIY